MSEQGRGGEGDEVWNWPDWVPAKVRESIESFYVYHGGHAGWLRSAERNGAPEFGSMVTLRDGFKRNAEPATGRFVFAWNNIARLVRVDGSFAYTAFYPDEVARVTPPTDTRNADGAGS